MEKEKREYNQKKNDFHLYVAKVFKDRMAELGMSRYMFLKKFRFSVTRYTLDRVLDGSNATRITTLAEMADKLGLEIIIRPKEDTTENKPDNETDD